MVRETGAGWGLRAAQQERNHRAHHSGRAEAPHGRACGEGDARQLPPAGGEDKLAQALALGHRGRRAPGEVQRALKPGGVLYFSVYEGERDGMYGGRYYCDYTKAGIRRLLAQFDGAGILNIWTTDDVRQDRADRRWLNVLVRKEKL